jgi:hypothetical protein
MSPRGPPIVRLFDGARQRVGVAIAVTAPRSSAANGRQEARRRPVARPGTQKKPERSAPSGWRARGVVSRCAAESQRRGQPGQHHPQR